MQQRLPFSSTPTSGQFAKSGVWEQAWSFPGNDLPDEASVRTYLGRSAEVAFEAFFGDAFFGARFTGEPAATAAFAVNCVRALRMAGRGESFCAVFCDYMQLDALGKHAAFAEIGAVNAWRSVGAFRIHNPQDALAELEHLRENLEHSPVGRDVLHRKAIEFAFEQPLPHWFGIPISSPVAPHEISPALLREALQLLAPSFQGPTMGSTR